MCNELVGLVRQGLVTPCCAYGEGEDWVSTSGLW